MEFRILGPLEVLRDGTVVDLGHAKQRAVLGVLLLHRGDVVSTERLIDELWGESPPPTATKVVQVYVSRLRKAIDDAAAARVCTQAPGYVFERGPDVVDADRFESLVAEARRTRENDDVAEAAANYREALALWRGRALGDLTFESFAANEAERLNELRLEALTERIDCDLRLGRHAGLVAELERLVAEHPLRESLHGQLMLALYRSGRQADALEAYIETRRALRDELGLEPGPELRRLEQEILRQDECLQLADPRRPLAYATSPVTTVPARKPLYRGGRQEEALAAYRDVRSTLVDEVGIERDPELRQLERRILAQGAVLLSSPAQPSHQTNLRMQPTALMGRQRELAEIVAHVRENRLVTLTGPGGSGKTRLAVHAAAELLEEFSDGIWFVPLALLRDPALVLTEVARVLEVEQPGRELTELLDEVLSRKRLLLVLDNAEHLLPDAAAVIALLRDAGRSKLLITSRERLQLAGEHVYSVPPLAKSEALALFRARARAVNATFESDAATEELCARLDNLPLAIELAAARTAVFSPEEILQRLSQALDLLNAGRDADSRQQTLRSTVAWSYDLLNPDERELFARLAVFAGGCKLDSAEQVCDAELKTLAALLDKSLLHRGGDRYWMLEMIREYAAERLDQSEHAKSLRQRHADFYERFAIDAEQGMRGPDVGFWFERVEEELPNVRSAVEFSLDSGEAAVVLRVSAALLRFWYARSAAEGLTWVERALERGDGTEAEKGKASLCAARLARFHGDDKQAMAHARSAIARAQSAGDAETCAVALGFCSSVLAKQGDHQQALALMRRCQELAPSVPDPWARAEATRYLTEIMARSGHHEQADRLRRELLATFRDLGDESNVAHMLNSIGYVALLRDDYDEARSALNESLSIARRQRETMLVTMTLGNLGLVAVLEGRYDDAVSLLREVLEICSSSGQRHTGREAILGLTAAHAALGNVELAVRLDTIRKSLEYTTGGTDPPALLTRLEPYLRLAWDQADSAPIGEFEQTGQTLTMDAAVVELQRHASRDRPS